MKQVGRLLVLMIGLLLIALPRAAAVRAQAGGQAGVVVVDGDGAVTTACVPISADVDDGLALLAASALPYTAATNTFGTTVCAIGNSGCPVDDCWCQCQGGAECIYWSLWDQVDGEWHYATAGAARLPVRAGTVQAWVWGPGTSGAAPPPPVVDLVDICAAPAADAAVTTTSSEAANDLVITAQPHLAQADASPEITETSGPTPGEGPSPTGTAIFVAAFISVILAGGLLPVWQRRRGGGAG